MSSPNVGSTVSGLSSIAAVSANDVWAVGEYLTNRSIYRTLIEHWDGTSWQVVHSPNAGVHSNLLTGVTAVSANDVWAVGYYVTSRSYRPLIEHWDGTSWQVVHSPNVGSSANWLSSVAAVSANDVWAVGYYVTSRSINRTLIEHWDGTSWQVVHSPNAGVHDSFLTSVAAVSANDVWAVGHYVANANPPNNFRTLIEHWDGTSWQVVHSPNVGSNLNELSSVAAVSASNVWAVGVYSNTSSYGLALIEHWDGTSWSVVSSPNVGSSANWLSSVAAVSASNVWAVGVNSNPPNNNQTLIEHWDGTSWSVVSSPNVGWYSNGLSSVAAVSASNVWAMGGYGGNGFGQTLAEFYC